uniref:LPD38 domain-containing protein n=2 Tax=unclassified Pseudomonas TaxID=196821 RepID=UPI00131A733D
ITNPDKFKLGVDSVKGLRAAFAQDEDYRDLMFGGASFAGGYANAADPGAAAESIRRALKAKGLTKAQQDSYLASLASTSGKLGDALAKGWEKYREIGERIENANRLATYKLALQAGKSRRQAAFEAKDLMDFSMRGNFVALQWLTDVVPFLNARLQGLGKLGRSYRDDKGQFLSQVVMKAGMLAAFSLILAALNGDDDRFKALPEWDKDANWHIWFSADQVEPIRIPKPFELGLLFGTLPERLLNVAAGNQDGAQLQGAIARGVVSTLELNPIPQFYMPIRDIQANKSLYFGTPIESLADEGKLAEARYDSRTSEVAKAVGQLTGPTLGLSPKQLDYLVKGYTGTLGAYVLGASDLVARQFQDGERPALTARQVPLVSVLYKGDSPSSTQYQTDLYDMVHEADEIYRTARAWRQEGRVEDAQQLIADNRDKLRHRGALGLARQQLGTIRAQKEQVTRSTSLSGEQKRARLDELQRRENRIAERVATRARADFN